MTVQIAISDGSWGLSDFADVANVLIALCALGVAFISIKFSRQALEHQQRHDALSVKPLPVITFANYVEFVRVKFVNYGVGPAIINSLSVNKSGEVFEDVISCMPDLPQDNYWRNFTSIVKGRPVAPGDEVVLIEYHADLNNKISSEFIEKCRLALAECEFIVDYTDVYGKRYDACVRSGDWFSLHDAEKRKLN